MATAQSDDAARRVGWASAAAGYPFALSVGIDDALAEDVHLRVDGALYFVAPLLIDMALELSVPVLVRDAAGTYAGAGPALTAGGSGVLLVAAPHFGTYLGVTGLVGHEFGTGNTRLFVEGGVTAGFKLAGEREAPAARVRPRLAAGVAFSF